MPRTNFNNERLDNLQGDLPSDGFMKRHETYYFFTIRPGDETKFNESLVVLAKSNLLSSVVTSRESRKEVIDAKQIAHGKGEQAPEKDMVNALIAFSMKGLQKVSNPIRVCIICSFSQDRKGAASNFQIRGLQARESREVRPSFCKWYGERQRVA